MLVGKTIVCKQQETKAMASPCHICEHCGKSLTSKSGHSRHVRKHQNKAPYRCCGQSFFERIKLEMHRCSTHGKPKTVGCDVCEKKFASMMEVRQHQRIVHQNVSFKCDVCGQEFKSKVCLRDHIGKHTGRKPYTCACGKSYQYSTGYYRHRKSCKKSTE